MLTLTLIGSLAAAPSAHALADSGAARGMLLRVDDEVPMVDATQPEVPLAQMTRPQLRAEYHRLEENRPPLAGQIVAVALGGATIAAGAIVIWGSLLSGLLGQVPLTTLFIGIGLLVGGGGLLTFGLVMLRTAMNERRPYNEAMQEVQDRLDGKFDDGQGPSRPPVEQLPPPPPPPPAAGLPPPPPMVVLATF